MTLCTSDGRTVVTHRWRISLTTNSHALWRGSGSGVEEIRDSSGSRTERRRRELSRPPSRLHDVRGTEGIERGLGDSPLRAHHQKKPALRLSKFTHEHATADGSRRDQAHDAGVGAFTGQANPRTSQAPA